MPLFRVQKYNRKLVLTYFLFYFSNHSVHRRICLIRNSAFFNFSPFHPCYQIKHNAISIHLAAFYGSVWHLATLIRQIRLLYRKERQVLQFLVLQLECHTLFTVPAWFYAHFLQPNPMYVFYVTRGLLGTIDILRKHFYNTKLNLTT